MAAILGTERAEVRRWMRDTKPGDFAIGTRELNRLIESEMHLVGDRLGFGQAWALAAISVDAVTDPPDYTLPGGATEYQHIVALRRASDKWPLQRISEADLLSRRRGSATPRGLITAFALLTGTAQGVTVGLDAIPNVAETLDLLRSVMPALFADSEGASIPFDRSLLEAFRQGCAARGIEMMSAEQRQARGLADGYVADLKAVYAIGVREAEVRSLQAKLSEPRHRARAFAGY